LIALPEDSERLEEDRRPVDACPGSDCHLLVPLDEAPCPGQIGEQGTGHHHVGVLGGGAPLVVLGDQEQDVLGEQPVGVGHARDRRPTRGQALPVRLARRLREVAQLPLRIIT
jgi:hypothetical protein